MTLPPGQHATSGFPRFGTHLAQAAPTIPSDPSIEISGSVPEPFAVPLTALASLPRREITADFHCVAGWSATGLVWEGVGFETFYRAVIEPVQPDTPVTHLVFEGLDGYRSVVSVDDAFEDSVLIAEQLNGHPLDGDHGAPARLVSPTQYGFVSTKHLCRIELHTVEPRENFGSASLISQVAFRTPLFRRHPRARVWEEERHPYLPAWALRPAYRLLTPPIALLSAQGAESDGRVDAP